MDPASDVLLTHAERNAECSVQFHADTRAYPQRTRPSVLGGYAFLGYTALPAH